MGSASLQYQDSDRATADVYCVASGFSLPTDTTPGGYVEPDPMDPQRGYLHRGVSGHSYSGGSYSWSFSDGGSASGQDTSYQFQNLTPGSKNSVSATVNFSYTNTETAVVEGWVSIPFDPSTVQYTVVGSSTVTQSATAYLDVYTRPEEFSAWTTKGLENETIEEKLKPSDWRTLADRAYQRKNWVAQEETDKTLYNTVKNNNVAGKFITVSIYNNMAELCEAKERVTTDTLIQPKWFIALQDAVNREKGVS